MNNGNGEWSGVKVNGEIQNIKVECKAQNDSIRRYVLRIHLKAKTQIEKEILVIMLNPSTANENKPDPTCKALMNLCDWNGYNFITICNLFSLRTPNPSKLNDNIDEANDTQNNDKLRLCIGQFDEVLCAWGNAKKIKERAKYLTRVYKVEDMLNGKKLKKIGKGLVDNRFPYHPYSFCFKRSADKYKVQFEDFHPI